MFRLKSLAVLGVFTAAAFAGGATWGLRSSAATTRDDSPYGVLGQLARVLVQVENDYVDPVDRSKLLNGAIKGMVEGLDPHSSYLPAQDFQIFQSETEGAFAGVGIEVDGRSDELVIIAPIEGSPAMAAGVKSGDRILAVDGEDTQRVSFDKLIIKMRGPAGSHVKLLVRRDHVRDPIMFDLVRAVVKVPSVASRMLAEGVGYIRIKQFQERTHEELLAAAARLRGAGRLTGIILDLRANPGGLVDQAAEVADEFLVGGTIYTTRHRGEIVDEVMARAGGAFSTMPTVVLVNEWSASASELVAGALQDQKRALIVGANTFGKGSVQSILQMPNGAGLRLTTARYYTPNGRSLQADGVHPDVVIESPHPGQDDGLPQLHERDLEGHLAAEPLGVSKTPNQKPPPVLRAPPDAGVDAASEQDAVEGQEARGVPFDPRKGSDFALRVGYQIVRSAPVDAPATR